MPNSSRQQKPGPQPDSHTAGSLAAAELPRLTLAYFEERAPATPDRISRSAYLQLSDAYQEAADEAERRNWPTQREAADHLAMLTRPELVVEYLVRLLQDVVAAA